MSKTNKLIKENLLKIVATLRAGGYLSQIYGGLHLAGGISLLGAIPLILWGHKNSKESGSYLKNNALKIHSYAGAITAIPLITGGLANYKNMSNSAYLEISLVGICLATAYLIFKMERPKFKGIYKSYLYKNKHQIGSTVLLLANAIQYHAGVSLGKSGLSFASIFFVSAIALQFFVKSSAIERNNASINKNLSTVN